MNLSVALLVSTAAATYVRPEFTEHDADNCDIYKLSLGAFRNSNGNIKCEKGPVSCNDGSCHCDDNRQGMSLGYMYQRRTPYANGCNMLFWPGDEHCCDQLDICYATAGKSKDSCDNDMCGYGGCLGFLNRWAPPLPTLPNCQFKRAMSAFSHYNNAQWSSVGCVYVPEWVETFINTFNGRRRMEGGEDDVIDIEVDESGNPIGEYAYLAGNTTTAEVGEDAANLLSRLEAGEDSEVGEDSEAVDSEA